MKLLPYLKLVRHLLSVIKEWIYNSDHFQFTYSWGFGVLGVFEVFEVFDVFEVFEVF